MAVFLDLASVNVGRSIYRCLEEGVLVKGWVQTLAEKTHLDTTQPALRFPLEHEDGLDWFFYTQAFYWAVATISTVGNARI